MATEEKLAELEETCESFGDTARSWAQMKGSAVSWRVFQKFVCQLRKFFANAEDSPQGKGVDGTMPTEMSQNSSRPVGLFLPFPLIPMLCRAAFETSGFLVYSHLHI